MRTENPTGQARIRVYDNGGKTADRYTVVYMDEPERTPGLYACLGMSERPQHPQGVGMHGIAQPGPHLGKRIRYADLPASCRAAVYPELGTFPAPRPEMPFDRFAVCLAFEALENDWNVGGWIHERPTNRRNREACSIQLSRIGFRAGMGQGGSFSGLLGDDPTDEAARDVYIRHLVKFGLAPLLDADDEVADYIRKTYVPEFVRQYFPHCVRPRVAKWATLYVVQGQYPGTGWEDLTASHDRRETRSDLKAYRENAPETVYRLIARRAPRED